MKFGDEDREYVLSIILPLKVAGTGQGLSGAGWGLAAKSFGHSNESLAFIKCYNFFFLNEELKEPVPWRQCIKVALSSLVF
jgi:hypothetical protein